MLIREARRRQRRRRALVLAVVVIGAALVARFGFGVGSAGHRPGAAPSGSSGVSSVGVRSVTFSGPFTPLQVVSAGGQAWVIGTTGRHCSAEEIDPATLHTTAFPLPACGYYVTVGDGLIYIAADEPIARSNGDQLHLEVFNPATKRASVMSPVIATTVGSSRAHLDLTYQTGSIWMSEWGNDLWKISPTTGAVVWSISNAPAGVGGHGLTGNPGGLWLTPGPGGPAAVYRIAPGSRTMSTVYRGPNGAVVQWLATTTDRVWAAVASPGATRLLAFDLDGRLLLETGNEQFGDVPLVGSTTEAWSIGSGSQCNSPQQLWSVDPATGRSAAVATLATPIEPCLTESPTGSQIALVNHTVMVLEATGSNSPAAVLYAIER